MEFKAACRRAIRLVVFPYWDPRTGRRTTARLRRDHPEIENGKPRNKYITAYGTANIFTFRAAVRNSLQIGPFHSFSLRRKRAFSLSSRSLSESNGGCCRSGSVDVGAGGVVSALFKTNMASVFLKLVLYLNSPAPAMDEKSSFFSTQTRKRMSKYKRHALRSSVNCTSKVRTFALLNCLCLRVLMGRTITLLCRATRQ